MTAQQQLVGLLARHDAAFADGAFVTEGAHWDRDAAIFLRDYGPALVELIEAAQKLIKDAPKHEPERPDGGTQDDVRDWAGEWEEWYTANQLRIPLKKLTEPK